MRYARLVLLVLLSVFLLGAKGCEPSQEKKDQESVDRQQSQYAKGQPVPAFDWSLERELLIELYGLRNERVATHSVWRSDYGLIEGDCPSMGYGLPYDTSLTNPLAAVRLSSHADANITSIGQAEPNGVFASTNTAATWVMCVGEAGIVSPVYVEAKVTGYPWPVTVDYEANRVTRAGDATVMMKSGAN